MKTKLTALFLLAATPAAAIDEETIGMLVIESMRPGSDAHGTGVAFLDTLEKIRHGGNVAMPEISCGTDACTGTYMAIEAAKLARRRR